MFSFANLEPMVAQDSATTGNGDLTLTAKDTFRTFVGAYGADNNMLYYAYRDGASPAEYECGFNSVSAGNVLKRDSDAAIVSSSNGNNRVVFSAGTKIITSDIPHNVINDIVANGFRTDVSKSSVAGQLGVIFNAGFTTVATTLDIAFGNLQRLVMLASFTLTAPSDMDGGYIELEVTVGAGGPFTLTLSGFNIISGTFDTSANAVNVLRMSKLFTNTYLEIIQAV